jgi:thymidylate synthase (FAD)
MISDGVCPEQARFVLPQGCEVNWVWTGSLYAYANFYNQRSNSHAQKEIQELAEAVSKIIEPLYPISWKALTKGDY